jgi:hypothetical protein
MGEKNDKTVKKTDFPKPAGRSCLWEGRGLVRRWPLATFKSDFS